jgi:large subunit ribosomal protein L23
MENSTVKNVISLRKNIIIKPRQTEKAMILQEQNIYTFDIESSANRSEVKKEIKRIYGIDAVKVNIAKTSEKKVFSRGRIGKKSGVKKAYVFLKKGDKITL